MSTAEDYARFCQMLLNGGELDGVRILSRKSVRNLVYQALHSSSYKERATHERKWGPPR